TTLTTFTAGFAALDEKAMALVMTPSSSSSSASLARTASPRWMRTGVSTTCPACSSTSKYCTGPSLSVTLFGRVSWFLDVSFASTRSDQRALQAELFQRAAFDVHCLDAVVLGLEAGDLEEAHRALVVP